ncbi:branched chain amino acid aminotransferase apoenzyme [Seinonella peptonophila]|uniref:Branched-chain-amino-acid aminotransferase n=1 Tax=Seinonella peptonophila TaxID=112248 RepID=A0A1M4TSG7_9BACL|nr:branched-chain-amino-acid transaminase [Seinonella peptonophila]SHE47421.1 branched chain amino acid aminotransferase apoenzyme [Seinonella peptonophila]
MSNSERYIFLNGEYKTKEQATVSVFDHGFLYGDGVFEGIRVYSGNVFRLREHLDRLYDSAKAILLTIPYTMDELEKHIVECVRKNDLTDAYLRLVVSRGIGELGLDPDRCSSANVVIIADQVRLYPKSLYEQGLPIVTASTRRISPDALDPRVKSLNYLNNILAKIEAKQAGTEEALMLNSSGYVAECTADNIFIVKKGIIYTPPSYVGALEGVTRKAIIDLAGKLGLTVTEEPFTLQSVYTADEVFITGTAAEVIPVVKVDTRQINDGKPGPVMKQLLEAFQKLVKIEGTQCYPEKVGLSK